MIKEEKMVILELEDDLYPNQLRNITNPPKKLYCTGDISLLNKRMVAVVGSRKTSSYGRWVAEKIAGKLVEDDFVVVSGMARGIDTFAHMGALAKEGKTVAVLGTGIDICFPSENRNLMEEIKQKGLVISEYPPGTEGTKWSFPMRNRIMAGLSELIIVAEAGLNSGALITADYAMNEGKPVMVVPGNINSNYSLGGNKLISDGAQIMYSLGDPYALLGTCKEEKIVDYGGLGNDEIRIVEILSKGKESTVEELSSVAGLSVAKINGILTVLEIKGFIHTSLGKVFLAK